MGKIAVSEEAGTPQLPSSGFRLLYPKADGWYELEAGGTERKVFSDQVYGSNYQFVKSTTTESNASGVYEIYLTITYPAGLEGVGIFYELDISALLRNSSASTNIFGRLAVDGVTAEGGEFSFEMKDIGIDVRDPTYHKVILEGEDLNPAGGVFTFEYRAEAGGNTATVHEGTMTFKRVV